MSVLLARTANPAGNAALEYAIAEANRRSEDLVVFHLKPKKTAGETVEGVAVRHVVPDALVLDTVSKLIDLASAQVEEFSCLVMGIKYRTPVGKMLLGSRAQQILLESRVPVISVKAG